MIPAPRTAPDDAPAPLPDQTLAKAACAGDRDALAELYRRHNDEVIAYVRHRTLGLTIAEDIAAEAWLRACRSIATFDGWTGAGFIGWVITIARNLLVDYFKSARFQRELRLGEDADAQIDNWLSPLQPQVDDIVIAQAVAAEVHAAVNRLSPLQQACITARFLEELSVAETAERLGIAESATKSLQYRATRTLARLLPTDPRTPTEHPA